MAAIAAPHPGIPVSAHDRLKARSRSVFWEAVVIATLLHFLALLLGPTFRAMDLSGGAGELTMIELPPEVVIPPPPQNIVRPATPVISDRPLSEEITIALTTMESYTPPALQPPPDPAARQAGRGLVPVFTPFTVAPELLNRDEVTAALSRAYPPLLRDAGIGDVVIVWFFIDENGVVQNSQVKEPSEFQAFNNAALDVATIMRFSPAQNRDRRVAVWVALPITFSVRQL